VGVDQPEVGGGVGVGEEPLAAPDEDRVDEDAVLVDEVALPERRDDVRAADHHVALLGERPDLVGLDAPADRRVAAGARQRAREHHLRHRPPDPGEVDDLR